MRTKHVLFMAILLCLGLKLSAQIDLVPGINYAYNPPGANGIITGIEVDAVNNDNGNAGSFDVAMYLYDQTTTNYWIIGTTNLPSLSGNSVITISNWNIDINNTSGIPAGTYRLGVFVDSNSDITETDENNNAGLLSGNINYTPSASGISSNSILYNSIDLFPNPANESVSLKFTLEENSAVSLNVYDMTGKLVSVVNDKEQMIAGDYCLNIQTVEIPSGVYFMTLTTGEVSVTRRLTVAH